MQLCNKIHKKNNITDINITFINLHYINTAQNIAGKRCITNRQGPIYLYTCVSYDVTEMNQIKCSVEENIIGYDQTCSITVYEVFDALCKLKPNKSDGNIGLRSDYFLHA